MVLYGKSGLQGPPTATGRAGGSSSPGHSAAAVPLGLLGSPYSQYGNKSPDTVTVRGVAAFSKFGRHLNELKRDSCVYSELLHISQDSELASQHHETIMISGDPKGMLCNSRGSSKYIRKGLQCHGLLCHDRGPVRRVLRALEKDAVCGKQRGIVRVVPPWMEGRIEETRPGPQKPHCIPRINQSKMHHAPRSLHIE